MERVPVSLGKLRREARAALTAAGGAATTLITNFDLARGTPAERFFHEQALAAGYSEMSSDHWPTEVETLSGDVNLVFRVNDNDRVYRFADGTLLHVTLGWGMISCHSAGPSQESAASACFGLRENYPASYLSSADDSRVPITFWSDSTFGPVPRLRKIEASEWDPIAGNYTAAVRESLEALMEWKNEPGADGQLLLWQGPPGTGKTWALRALASEWSKWAEFHYITDPDAFFVKNPSYMIDVLLSDSYMAIEPETGEVFQETDAEGKWRVLILEDTGELLGANAKQEYGQGLSRLLNVVDGMIGQGLRVLALVTTNDELGDLHPAVSRPGRCASQIEFAPLSADEATAWLGEDVDAPATIAELFALGAGTEGVEPLAELAMSGECANCGHMASDHLGGDNAGPCTDGDCSCNGMEEAAIQASNIAEMFVAIRPQVVPDFREQIAAQLSVAAGGLGTFRIVFDDPALLADGATAPPLPDAHQPGERLPERRPGVTPAAPAKPDENSSGLLWTATLCPEGHPTDDGRVFAPDAIEWRELPLTLMAMTKTSAEGGHDGAEVAGRIDNIWREGDLIRGSGEFDAGEYGIGIAGQVGNGTLRGISVDLAISEMEIAYRSSVLDENGNWIGGDGPASEEDAPNMLDILGGSDEEVMFVVWKATIGMATVCPFQAFAEATIELTDALTAASKSPNPFLWTLTRDAGFELARRPLVASLETMEGEPGEGVQLGPEGIEPIRRLTAAALSGRTAAEAGMAPAFPPSEWFAHPSLEELTALQVDEEGRIFGHAAAWDVCHTGFPDQCVTAPHSDTLYSYFHLKEVICEEGERIACGTITLDTGHAGGRLSRAEATAHYDHTGTAVADITVGEDEFGIWVAGAVRPGVDETQVRILRGAVLSGDWRNVNGNLELVALLAVNVPGFPVPRVKALFASAGAEGSEVEVLALTAAGITTSELHLPKATQAQFDALRDRASGRYAELAARARG